MRKPVLAYIPAAVSNNAVHAAQPFALALSTTRASKATRVNKDGIIEEVPSGLPRQDWSDGDCPSLLLEPERENLYTYSEISTGKTIENVTLTDNSAISPNGELTAIKVTDDSVNFRHRFQSNNISVVSGTQYTISFYVKKDSPNRYVYINAGILGANGSFSLDDQSTTGSVQVFETLNNGWYRIGLTGTAPTTQTSVYFLQMQLGIIDASYIGDGSSFYVWGLQFEQGSYPTSYIKTEASPVTRVKDSATSWGNSSMFDITEGSFFVDTTPFTREATDRITLSDNTYDNRILISKFSSTQLQFIVVSNSVTVATYTTNINYNVRNKIAFTLQEDKFKFYLNGNLVYQSGAGSMPTGLNDLSFKGIGSALYWSGKVYDTRVYDYALSEEEAIKLTS